MAFHGGFDLQVARDDRALVCRVVAAGAHAYVLGVIVVGHECETGLRRTFTALCRDAGVLDCDIMASRVWTSSCMLEFYDMYTMFMESKAKSPSHSANISNKIGLNTATMVEL